MLDEIEDGIRIQLGNGENCGQGNYTTTLEIACDKNGTGGVIEFDPLNKIDKNSCKNTLKAKSYDGKYKA